MPIYKELKKHGTNEEVAALTIKVMFDHLSNSTEGGVSLVSLANHVGDAFKMTCRPSSFFDDDAEKARLGLHLVKSCLNISNYFEEPPRETATVINEDDPMSLEDSRELPPLLTTVRLKNIEEIADDLSARGDITPLWSPLIVPPKPWKSMVDGTAVQYRASKFDAIN